MPVVSREISHSSPHSQRLRIRLAYTFDGGRVITRGPMFVADQAAADARLLALEPDVLASVQAQDAEAVELSDSSITDTAEASRQQIARQYLHRAMQEDDPYIALNKIRKAQTFFQAQGWTVSQIKLQLNISDALWDKITARYSYLQSVEQTLIDYQAILVDDTERDD